MKLNNISRNLNRSINRDSLPKWWQDALKEFEEDDLHPFQPPRFSDDIVVPELIEALEKECNIVIDIIGLNSSYDEDWKVRVNDSIIGEIGRYRTSAGYTEYKMESEKFVGWVLSKINDDSCDVEDI